MSTANKQNIFTVPEECRGVRLDIFLARSLPCLSRVKIHNLIRQSFVLVNNKVKKPSFSLNTNQIIRILNIPEEKNILEPYDFPVKIIHEDKDILIVDKPSGLTVHPPQKKYHQTLVNALLYQKKILSSLDPLRPGIVHRLDKETSGLMVVAKNNESHNNLVQQFKQRKINKQYKAIVWGIMNEDSLEINLPVCRDKKNRLKMKVGFLQSKTALTRIKTIKVLKDSTLLSVKPFTGRMHQIRVHLRFLGFPIVGDHKYGKKDTIEHLLLHAEKLEFCHPSNKTHLTFESPLPKRFNDFILSH